MVCETLASSKPYLPSDNLPKLPCVNTSLSRRRKRENKEGHTDNKECQKVKWEQHSNKVWLNQKGATASIKTVTGGEASDCQKACSELTGCKGYTFLKGSKCELKAESAMVLLETKPDGITSAKLTSTGNLSLSQFCSAFQRN